MATKTKEAGVLSFFEHSILNVNLMLNKLLENYFRKQPTTYFEEKHLFLHLAKLLVYLL